MKILIEKAVIEQALDALEQWKEHDAWHKRNDWNDEDESAITAMREALTEQAEQEPVLSYHIYDIHTKLGHEFFYEEYKWHKDKPRAVLNQNIKIDLYAAPVRTKDLTDDEIEELMNREFPQNDWLWHYTRAVIAADRKKNR